MDPQLAQVIDLMRIILPMAAIIVAVAVGGTLLNNWQLPMYNVDFSKVPISLDELRKRRERDTPPFVDDRLPRARWAKPELVAQIAFTEWTRDGRLRHPRYEGLRDDKPASEVVREEPAA